MEAWTEHVLSIAAERFERRPAREIGGLEIRLQREMRAAFTAVLSYMLRNR